MRLVFKIGTSLVTTETNKLDTVFLRNIVRQIAALRKKGHQVVIVSSGAVASGRSELKIGKTKKNIPIRQALAAVGQGLLMKAYHDFFEDCGIVVAQALLTNYDFVNRENFLNTRSVFELLLKKGVTPIVNENDVTTVAELKFGDNDMLSAKTAAMVCADCLVILTDVDGLYSADPKNNPDAKLINTVNKIDDSVKALAKGPRTAKSRGGMITKIESAEYVSFCGIPMMIVNGRKKDAVSHVIKTLSGKESFGTLFNATFCKIEINKLWMRPKILKNAFLSIDDGAYRALTQNGKSLLPSGISAVTGKFNRGDVVMIRHADCEIAYGQVNYDSESLDEIKKHHSDEVEGLLGFSFEEEVIHRDHMVVLK